MVAGSIVQPNGTFANNSLRSCCSCCAIKTCCCRVMQSLSLGPREVSKVNLVPWDPLGVCFFSGTVPRLLGVFFRFQRELVCLGADPRGSVRSGPVGLGPMGREVDFHRSRGLPRLDDTPTSTSSIWPSLGQAPATIPPNHGCL